MELFTPKLELGYARKQFYETGDLQALKKHTPTSSTVNRYVFDRV